MNHDRNVNARLRYEQSEGRAFTFRGDHESDDGVETYAWTYAYLKQMDL